MLKVFLCLDGQLIMQPQFSSIFSSSFFFFLAMGEFLLGACRRLSLYGVRDQYGHGLKPDVHG